MSSKSSRKSKRTRKPIRRHGQRPRLSTSDRLNAWSVRNKWWLGFVIEIARMYLRNEILELLTQNIKG